uniref:Uncharacterized protein n=1 Tax=Rhizophora mucronata TaxID=61149 RepID=A0A2P2N7L6_RHIMU
MLHLTIKNTISHKGILSQGKLTQHLNYAYKWQTFRGNARSVSKRGKKQNTMDSIFILPAI